MSRSVESQVKRRVDEIRKILNTNQYNIYNWELRNVREELAKLLELVDLNLEAQKAYQEAYNKWREENRPPEKPKMKF